MGLIRKTLFLGSGGFVSPNSKKQRYAKQQIRLQKQMLKAQQTVAQPSVSQMPTQRAATMPLYNVRCPKCSAMVQLPASKSIKCPQCKYRMSVTPNQPTAARVPVRDTTSELERLARLHSSGALTDDEFATAKAAVFSQGVESSSTPCPNCGSTNWWSAKGKPRRCTKCGTEL